MPLEKTSLSDPNTLYRDCATCPSHLHCCYRATTIVVLPEEKERILKKTSRDDVFTPEEGGLFVIKKNKGEPCPFLTTDNLCGIYDIRPVDCRSWPITSRLQNDKVNGYVRDDDCPAFRHAHITTDYIAAAKTALDSIPVRYKVVFSRLVYRDTPRIPFVDLLDVTGTVQTGPQNSSAVSAKQQSSGLLGEVRKRFGKQFVEDPMGFAIGTLVATLLLGLVTSYIVNWITDPINPIRIFSAVGFLSLQSIWLILIFWLLRRSDQSRIFIEHRESLTRDWRDSISSIKSAAAVSIDNIEDRAAKNIEATKEALVSLSTLQSAATIDFAKEARAILQRPNWLVTEREAMEIERAADSQVIVCVPNLYYEEADEYLKIIATNLLKKNVPYKYLLEDNSVTRAQWNRVRGRLYNKLHSAAKGDQGALRDACNRFQLWFCPPELFPHAVFSGIAIYVFRERAQIRCLQYVIDEANAGSVAQQMNICWGATSKDATDKIDAVITDIESRQKEGRHVTLL